jgi:hypothetical protein
MLRKVCRISAPVYTVWEKAIVREGIEWDVDTDLASRPHIAKVEKDEAGEIERAFFQTSKQAQGLVKSGRPDQKQYRAKEMVYEWDVSELQVSLTMTPQIAALVLKLALAAGGYWNSYRLDSDECKKLKADFISYATTLVTYDNRTHSDLEKSKSPLSHVIYLHSARRPFAVVQLYSSLQFYVSLPPSEPRSEATAHLAVLDVVDGYKEKFVTIGVNEIGPPAHSTGLQWRDVLVPAMHSFSRQMATLSCNPEVYLKDAKQ